MKPSVSWWSNSPHAPTGYGVQTKAVAWRLADAGYPTAVLSNYGVEGIGIADATDAGTPCPIYPRGYDGYSQDVIVAHYLDWRRQHGDRPSLLVTLYDTWVLKAPQLDQVPAILSWTPLDHITVPPEVLAWCRKGNVVPLAMSKFGLGRLEAADLQAEYVPHTVEPAFGRRSGGGELMKAPDDAFVVMMNAANKGRTPTRKAWSENFLALAPFLSKHRDAVAYFHTEVNTPYGIDLRALAAACGLPADRLLWADQYRYRMGAYSSEDLARLYSRAGVLLAVSMGEGFGIPTVEAQACGTRVIGSDAAATPELLGSDSWAVPGQPEWDPLQGAFFFRPFVHGITAALEEAYRAGSKPSKKAVAKASEYSATAIVPRRWPELVDRYAA